MNSITLDITSAGAIRTIYTEAIPLRELGTLQVARASTVEFDATAQEWVVRVHGAELFRNTSRQTCLEWEINHDDIILDTVHAAQIAGA